MSEKSKAKYSLRKQLKKLGEIKGSGTELISVYVPPKYPIAEVSNKLKNEYGQAANIKSKSTRDNVLTALEKIIHYLKMFREPPENGMAVFCGNISSEPGKPDVQLFSLVPHEPINIQTYRCDSSFFLEPLSYMLEAKDAYGMVVMDGRDATIALLKGKTTKIIKRIHSLAHGKHHKGGQCLAAGTLVVKEDGEIIDVKNFEAGSELVGLDFSTMKTSGHIASDFFATPAKRSILIETECPLCEIRTTPYHRFFVISEHGIKEKFAKDLNESDKVLVAKKINCNGSRRGIAYTPKKRLAIDENEREKLRDARARLGLTQKEAAKAAGLSQMRISNLETGKKTPSDENLRGIYAAYGLELDETRLAKKTLKFPEQWNEDLARLFGIICGDGTLDGNRIIVYEGSEEIVKKYCSLVERAIGIKPTVRTVDKRGQPGSFAKKEYYEMRIYSLEFVNAIMQIAPEIVASERDVPKEMTKCDDEIVASFLSGLYDAEGYFCGNRVDIAMTSKRLMQKIQLLLLRLGILSSFAEKRVEGNKQWNVSISDRESVARFGDEIGFARSDKKRKLERICAREAKQQYIDQIPIDGREVFRLAQELGMKTGDFHAASGFFRNVKQLGRKAFARNILPVFEKSMRDEKGKEATRLNEIFEFLSRVYRSDFTVASIKRKTEVANCENFYDVTIPVHSNFIANGFIVHNSARRFERLIEEETEKYYKKIGEGVDESFLNVQGLKGVIVGGPGPAKENFLKLKPFNYQIKILGVVDTGYTDEYGIRELQKNAEEIISEQEAVKEKAAVESFIKEVVKGGLATYGFKEVEETLKIGKASKLIVSEGLILKRVVLECAKCKTKEERIVKEAADAECSCGGKKRVVEQKDVVDELLELAEKNSVEIEVISTETNEGAQFLKGFYGIGALLRYR